MSQIESIKTKKKNVVVGQRAITEVRFSLSHTLEKFQLPFGDSLQLTHCLGFTGQAIAGGVASA